MKMKKNVTEFEWNETKRQSTKKLCRRLRTPLFYNVGACLHAEILFSKKHRSVAVLFGTDLNVDITIFACIIIKTM